MNKVKEVEWTVAFDFPEEIVYPTNDGRFDPKMNENTLSFTSKQEANLYGIKMAGKYGFVVVPTVIETTIENKNAIH